jgi:hypothetical protein
MDLNSELIPSYFPIVIETTETKCVDLTMSLSAIFGLTGQQLGNLNSALNRLSFVLRPSCAGPALIPSCQVPFLLTQAV